MSSFDFSSYIEKRFGIPEANKPNTDTVAITNATGTEPCFTVQVLTGGYTNHTARITFNKPLREVLERHDTNSLEKIGESEMATRTSVVLKHASPYFAVDPTKAISVDRQLMEKKALQIFHLKGGVTLEGFGLSGLFEEKEEDQGAMRNKKTAIQIPKLIWHDIERNVLWIEDLGRMRTLSEVLLDPFRSSDSEKYLAVGDAGADTDTGTRTQIRQIATDLGAFLARLYETTANPPQRLVDYLTSLSNPSGMYDQLANMVLENLQRPEARVLRADAEILTERVRMGLSEIRKGGAEDVCLGMVDFWPESVLIELGMSGVGETEGVLRCGLVDWEYFGPSNAASELGMFLAHLHVHMLNATTSSKVTERVQLFAEAMFRAYAESQSEVDWKPSDRFKRRALLSHGRELVNGVVVYDGKLGDTVETRILGAGVRSLKAGCGSDKGVDLRLLRGSMVEHGRESREGEDIERIWQAFVALRFDKD